MDLKKTQQTIDEFEEEIRRQLKDGKTPQEATTAAYVKYPVMTELLHELKPQIMAEMVEGGASKFSAGELEKAADAVWAEDGLTLSQRTTKGSEEVIASVSSIISENIEDGKGIKSTLISLFDGYGKGGVIPEQEIPRFMEEVIKTGKLQSIIQRFSRRILLEEIPFKPYEQALKKANRNIEKMRTKSLRAAYQQILDVMDDVNEKRLEKAVYVATQEKTRYFAERIARTELARAFNDGFFEKWSMHEDCVAFKWNVSTRHPDFDICDLYAEANLYGMGNGIFPKDKVPTLPVHPHCMCRLRPVFVGSKLLKGSEVDRVKEGGKEWFDAHGELARKRVFGVNGAGEVALNHDWRNVARGYSDKFMKSRLENTDNYGKLGEKVTLPYKMDFPDELGIKRLIPRGSEIVPKKIMAGAGSEKELRIANKIAANYGGRPERWSKVSGIITSDKFIFDIHWYQYSTVRFEDFKVSKAVVRSVKK